MTAALAASPPEALSQPTGSEVTRAISALGRALATSAFHSSQIEP